MVWGPVLTGHCTSAHTWSLMVLTVIPSQATLMFTFPPFKAWLRVPWICTFKFCPGTGGFGEMTTLDTTKYPVPQLDQPAVATATKRAKNKMIAFIFNARTQSITSHGAPWEPHAAFLGLSPSHQFPAHNARERVTSREDISMETNRRRHANLEVTSTA